MNGHDVIAALVGPGAPPLLGGAAGAAVSCPVLQSGLSSRAICAVPGGPRVGLKEVS